MGEGTICVNTALMKRDIEALRQSLLQIYQSMEVLEVSLIRVESFWEGAAKETYFQMLTSQWEHLLHKKQAVETGITQMDQIRQLYMECERQVLGAVTALR